MAKVSVFYKCDGLVEKCMNHPNCYKNGGDCRMTQHVEHAKNFSYVEHCNGECYHEKPSDE